MDPMSVWENMDNQRRQGMDNDEMREDLRMEKHEYDNKPDRKKSVILKEIADNVVTGTRWLTDRLKVDAVKSGECTVSDKPSPKHHALYDHIRWMMKRDMEMKYQLKYSAPIVGAQYQASWNALNKVKCYMEGMYGKELKDKEEL